MGLFTGTNPACVAKLGWTLTSVDPEQRFSFQALLWVRGIGIHVKENIICTEQPQKNV